jgi:AcrR family transcriptional regulator
MSTHTGDRRAAGAGTRLRILAAAVELFSRQGYAGTSIRDIAEVLGMTKASLYYHFSSKEEILDAVTAPVRAQVAELVTWAAVRPAPPAADLLAALTGLLSRNAPLLGSLFSDPSAAHRGLMETARDQFAGFAEALAGSAAEADLLRARCAIGAVRGGVMGTLAQDPRFAEPPDSQRALRLLSGEEELLTEGQCQDVAQAALRALGPPAGSSPAADQLIITRQRITGTLRGGPR